MTNNSTEGQPMNNVPPGYGNGLEQDQTAILIENDRLRAEIEVARAAQQEQNRRCCNRGFIAVANCIVFIYNIFVLFYNASLWSSQSELYEINLSQIPLV